VSLQYLGREILLLLFISSSFQGNAFSGMRRLLKCILWVDFDLDDIYVLNSWEKSRTNVDFDLDNLHLEQREETKSGKK